MNHIKVPPNSLYIICYAESSSFQSTQCSSLCLSFFFQLPIRIVASPVAVYFSPRQKEKYAISSPDLLLLSKYEQGVDLLDTYISW